MDKEISAHLIRLRRLHPFLATISMFASYLFNDKVNRFTTDGRTISINPDYYRQLANDEKTGLLLHLTLHAALQHATRKGRREENLWNTAADIVVNNIILEADDFKPPKDTAVEQKYKEMSVEQVYEELSTLPKKSSALREALKTSESSCCREQTTRQGEPDSGGGEQTSNPECLSEKQKKLADVIDRLYPSVKDISYSNLADSREPRSSSGLDKTDRYWDSVFRRAEVVRKLAERNQGDMPTGLLREIDVILNPELDWRWLLWNYVVRTPTDFEGFDRRFAYRGLYIDVLESETLNVAVAIDSSGSIDEDELAGFVSELQGIAHAYHFISIQLYFVDADIYGPYDLERPDAEVVPRGGGGTDFAVFFEHILQDPRRKTPDVIVYFTDGFGLFPKKRPDIEILWVVCPGGRQSCDFPFGRVARLSI